jgi:hypothetical protein
VLGLIGGVSCPGFGVWIGSPFGVFFFDFVVNVSIGCARCSLESSAFGKLVYSVFCSIGILFRLLSLYWSPCVVCVCVCW